MKNRILLHTHLRLKIILAALMFFATLCQPAALAAEVNLFQEDRAEFNLNGNVT